MRTVAYVTSCFLPYASKLIKDIYLSVILMVSHDNSIWKIEKKNGKITLETPFLLLKQKQPS